MIQLVTGRECATIQHQCTKMILEIGMWSDGKKSNDDKEGK